MVPFGYHDDCSQVNDECFIFENHDNSLSGIHMLFQQYNKKAAQMLVTSCTYLVSWVTSAVGRTTKKSQRKSFQMQLKVTKVSQ